MAVESRGEIAAEFADTVMHVGNITDTNPRSVKHPTRLNDGDTSNVGATGHLYRAESEPKRPLVLRQLQLLASQVAIAIRVEQNKRDETS